MGKRKIYTGGFFASTNVWYFVRVPPAALHPRKFDFFLKTVSARVKEIVIAPNGLPKWGGEKSTPKKGPSKCAQGQLPISNYRCRISDPMLTIIRCSAGQYMTITCVQLTARYM